MCANSLLHRQPLATLERLIRLLQPLTFPPIAWAGRASRRLWAVSAQPLLAPAAKGLDKRGAPVRIPEKDHHIGGALVSPNNDGVTNLAAACVLAGYRIVLRAAIGQLRDVL